MSLYNKKKIKVEVDRNDRGYLTIRLVDQEDIDQLPGAFGDFPYMISDQGFSVLDLEPHGLKDMGNTDVDYDDGWQSQTFIVSDGETCYGFTHVWSSWDEGDPEPDQTDEDHEIRLKAGTIKEVKSIRFEFNK
jgi:hypothetical protein